MARMKEFLTLPLSLAYDSDRFVVTCNDNEYCPTYEVADKTSQRSAFLHGAPAELLYDMTQAWKDPGATPCTHEVDSFLERLTFLNSHALAVH